MSEVLHEWAVDLPLGNNPKEAALKPKAPNTLADIDPRLLTEAFRRARDKHSHVAIDADGLLSAIIAEARRGTRDLYGLTRAAEAAAASRAI